MFLRCAKFDPNGNTTLLVLDSVSRNRQPRVAEQLMRDDLQVEQVGFLEAPEDPAAQMRLQMMGGEFCGNATMSVASYLARRDHAPMNQQRRYILEVSGAKRTLDCSVCPLSGEHFAAEVPMPLPQEISQVQLLPGCMTPLVRFPGIVHAILPEGVLDDAQAQTLISRSCAALGAEAMGLIFVNARFDRIRPLVYVRETQSCVWESGCGSGTAALGAWRASVQQGDVDLRVQQACPENHIAVRASFANGHVDSLRIGGHVRLLAMGCAWVADEKGFD